MSARGRAPATAAEVRALRLRADHESHLRAALALAAAHPSEPAARVEAALALDHAGDRRAAARHYDAAWQLGVATPDRRAFLVSYAAALRDIGRGDQAVVLLSEELAREPHYLPYAAFLALALHAERHHDAAMATLLGALLDAAERCAEAGAAHPLDGQQRALGAHYNALLDAPAR
jgi:tetratricopeptide (TPR) repeat protein